MTTTEGTQPFTKAEARQATDKARSMTVHLAQQLAALKKRQAHTALGYATWKAYVEKEFELTPRYVRYLVDFANNLTEIAERTGVENPPLTQKDLRDATQEEKDEIVGAANKAIENGEDPHEAIKGAGQAVKEKAKRKPRTKGDGTAPKSKPAQSSSPEESTDETTDDRPSINDLTADDVETAPEHDSPAEPRALPVKLPSFSYELWAAFTLACRDEFDAARMRADFEGLMDSVDVHIHAEDDAEQRMSA